MQRIGNNRLAQGRVEGNASRKLSVVFRIVTAAIGLAINLLVAWLLACGEKRLNTPAATQPRIYDMYRAVA